MRSLSSPDDLRELYAPLVAFLRGLGLSSEDAEDLAQESLLAAFRNRHSFRGEAKLSTWVFGIAKRQWLQWRRRERRRERQSVRIEPVEEHGPRAQVTVLESGLPRPDEVALARERHRVIRQAMASLPSPMADALLLYAQDGRSYKEIAALLRSDVNHVSSLIYQARQKLRRIDPGVSPEKGM